jgi:alpha-galactosidase/6-phospho-beta-glucosidase family protein
VSGDQVVGLSVLVSRDGVKVLITPQAGQRVSALMSPDQAVEMARALVAASEKARRMISGPDVVGHG